MTGSLFHVVLACHLAELSDCSSPDYLQVPRVYADSLLPLRHVLDSNCRTVSQDRFVDAMTTRTSQLGADRKGIDFQVDVHSGTDPMERSGGICDARFARGVCVGHRSYSGRPRTYPACHGRYTAFSIISGVTRFHSLC